MNASHVRIGNLVIDRQNEKVITVDENVIYEMANGMDFYAGIPITSQGLKLLGFTFSRSGAGGQDEWAGYGYWSFKDFHLLGGSNPNVLFFQRERRWKITHIHQLQNLHLALEGTELKPQQ